MSSDTKKPMWSKIYYGISIILILFAIIGTFIDKSGFAIITTGPIAIFGILLAGFAYGVYYSKKVGKKLTMNIILWLFFLISTLYFLYGLALMEGSRTVAVLIFLLICSLLMLELLIILNKD